MSRYTCCANYMPCNGRCGESKSPEFCIATKVFLCFGNSVASTRFLLQDESNIQTTQCDNYIIGLCLHANSAQDRNGFGPQPIMVVPPIQQMSHIDQHVPPSVGYPPQPTYGVQSYGHPPPPPPPPQGYSATGFPPAAYPPPGYPPSG